MPDETTTGTSLVKPELPPYHSDEAGLSAEVTQFHHHDLECKFGVQITERVDGEGGKPPCKEGSCHG